MPTPRLATVSGDGVWGGWIYDS